MRFSSIFVRKTIHRSLTNTPSCLEFSYNGGLQNRHHLHNYHGESMRHKPSNFTLKTNVFNSQRSLSSGTIDYTILKKDDSNNVIDFPQLLNISPHDFGDDEWKITSFPLLNPWRIGVKGMVESESDVQIRREKELQKLFPTAKFPSVTRILQATMDESGKDALLRWKERMIKEMGEVPFIQHQRKTFHRGSSLHKNIAAKLTSPETHVKVPEEIEGYWESLSPVFPAVSNIKMMEHQVFHPFLCYSGVADCIATMGDDLVLIDWKTSSRHKPDLSYLYDEPIQAVSYAGAVNFTEKLSQFLLEKVVIVIAYDDGSPANVHQLSHSHCRDYWKMWLLRLKQYWKIVNEDKLRKE